MYGVYRSKIIRCKKQLNIHMLIVILVNQMGFFDGNQDINLENADLNCEPQNDFVSPTEVKPIDAKLEPGEKVHFVFTGGSGLQIDGEKKSATGSSRTVITDRRVLLKVSSGPLLAGSEYHSLKYENIASVSLAEGILHVRLDIETSSKTYGVYLTQASLSTGSGDQAVSFIQQKMDDISNNREKGIKSELDPFEKVEELKQLKENGVISPEEFEEKKEDILERI